jgi:hypothetical protein
MKYDDHKPYREMIRDKFKEVGDMIRKQDETVNHPPHYKQNAVEAIHVIQAGLGAGFADYLKGNIMKYLIRYKHKNGVEDLKKAQWYLAKLIEVEDGREKN